MEHQETLRADVIVVGGGIAGISAALAAARGGARTMLVEREYLLGGLATLGLIAIYLPLCDGKGHQVSFGIAEELLRLSICHGADGEYPDAWLSGNDIEKRKAQRFRVRYNPHMFALLSEQALLEAGVKILYGCQLTGVDVRGRRVVEASAAGRTDALRLSASVWIDATGDATLAAMAGEETRLFQKGNPLAAWYAESNGEGGEKLRQLGAADVPDDRLSKDAPKPLVNRRFTGLETPELSEMTVLSHRCLLEDALRRQVKPLSIPSIPQVRMSRCLVGKAVLDDSQPHRREPASIGMISDWRRPGPVYEVPVGVLSGHRIDNLYAAGRCISVTDGMWDISRVIPPCAVTGQAAGTIAALQCRGGAAPDLASIQQALVLNGVKLHEGD